MHSPELQTYHDLLLQWQKTINLIAPSTVKGAWVRHFEDSLQVMQYLPDSDDQSSFRRRPKSIDNDNTGSSLSRGSQGADRSLTLCDIGSGAGFPGMVIALERPDIDVHLVESDTRKCAFLKTVSRETSAKNVIIHNRRIEDVLPDLDCDIVTARALASLDQLIAYTQSQWSKNSDFQMILLKGAQWQSEITQAQEKYDFIVQDFPSAMDKNARILIVGNIRDCAR